MRFSRIYSSASIFSRGFFKLDFWSLALKFERDAKKRTSDALKTLYRGTSDAQTMVHATHGQPTQFENLSLASIGDCLSLALFSAFRHSRSLDRTS